MKLHQKGFLLVTLSQVTSMWDQPLILACLKEYGTAGSYAENSIRIALDELAAGGLITRLEEKIDTQPPNRLLFHYQLTPFGRARMLDTGLL